MGKINFKDNNLVVDLDSSVERAMERITDNQRGAVVVVDEEQYLQGVVSDGDIRRAMLRGATMLTPVSKILNPNTVSVEVSEVKTGRAEEIFQTESSINLLPVVDKKNKVIDVIIRNPDKRKEL